MRISLVVAMDRNQLIGRDQRLPWHLPADLAHFKQTTMGKPILMGRKTWESIGRALPGRRNLVLTRRKAYEASGAEIVDTADAAIRLCQDTDELMVIGGAGVYREFLPRATRIYLTRIDAEFDGDTFFPELDRDRWHEVTRIDHAADARNAHAYSFVTLEADAIAS